MSSMLEYYRKTATAIVDRADAEGRGVTAAEEAEIRHLAQKASRIKNEQLLYQMVDGDGGFDSPVGASRGLLWSVKSKGFTLSQKVEGIDPSEVFHVSSKALGEADEASILRLPGIIPEGFDKRFVYANIPAKNPGDATSVDVLVSDSRSLSADVDVIDSNAQKSQTDSGASLAHLPMQRAATVTDYYPNAIVGLDAFRQLVDTDMRSAIMDALDAYVVGTLAGEADVDSSQGSDTYEQIRKAITAIQSNGFTPNLAAISPADAEALDLERGSAEKAFILPPAPRNSQVSPLWGVKVIVAKAVSDGEPIILDTTGVEFYLGNLVFAADPLTKFDTNESRFRLEGPTLLAVRQPGAVAGVASSS